MPAVICATLEELGHPFYSPAATAWQAPGAGGVEPALSVMAGDYGFKKLLSIQMVFW